MEKNQKKSKLLTAGGIGLAVVILIIILLLTRCGGFTSSVSPAELSRLLADASVQTIEVNGDVVIEGPLEVNGTKTIIGNGRILLSTPLEGEWPEGDTPTWGMGCAAQNPADGTAMPALLNVTGGSSLTLGGSVTVDAQGNGNVINVADKGSLKISENAVVQNGRYANVVIAEKADALIEGGQVLEGNAYNILNYGKLRLAEGTVSGAKAGSVVYNSGSFTQEGGTVSYANFHNVYVAEGGSFTMTGGLNDYASKDGVMIAEGGSAEVTGGDISNCIHGLCNSGEMTTGKVLLSECGIMNYGTGTLNMTDTTVDTSEVYCLSNNGGTVNAENFTAIGCDTCAIYNFSGDMNLVNVNVNGSRDGNIANAGGNLTIDGGTLDVCRDKSLVVGNGKAVVNNVTFLGTTGDKYGVYSYGGETYLNDCTIQDVSSTAVKIDAGAYVELNNVDIKNAEQNGFQNDGGQLVANDVTMENMNSHGIYNNGGEITVNGLEVTGVKKNAIQHKSGTTIVDGMDASDMGNHGAYVAEGTLTVKNSSLDDMGANGFYIIAGDNKLVLNNVRISNAVQQGINNSSTVTATNLSISNTGKNGIYNKTGASMSVSGLTVSNVAEHGINNKSTMTASNVTISGTGAGSNGIQNNGTMTLNGASVAKSKNHGVYNSGTLNASGISVDTTKENGVYNDKGTATIKGLTVNGSGTQGVNNNSTIKLEDVKITKAGSNGIYNSKGEATVDGLTVDGTGEHGVSNAANMTLSNASIQNTGDSKNGVQNTGTLIVNGVKVASSKNHGVYNEGTISGAGITASSVAGNGIYNNGGTISNVDGITVSDAKDQGINNTGSLTATNVDVSGTGKNGVYNNAGTATITGLKVTNPGQHGVSNNPAENGSGKDAVLTLKDATIDGSGEGSNNIQNKGTLVVEDVTLKNSANHGIYNDNKVTSKGTLTVSGAAVNGIYNYGGDMDLASVSVSGSGEHGVNNAGLLDVTTLAVSGVTANGIQNSGTMTVSGSAVLANSGKHGIYNGNTFNGTSITVNGAGDLLASNAGDMIVHGMYLGGAAHKAVYNSGYAELYNATINGEKVTNGGTAEYLVDNNGGILDLTNASLINANGTALHNRGKSYAAVTNVIIDGAGNYGIFVEGGAKLSGDGLVVNNVTKNSNVSGAEGYAIKNQGTITMMDHVTLGDYAAGVTGSGTNSGKGTSGIASTALTNDAATASYSGYDLTIKNAPSGNAVYNKGILYVTDLYADTANHGVVNRYSGWSTLSGTVTIRNIKNNPVSNYGPESGSYKNGLTLVSGATMTIENCGSHAINNKGAFEAAADTTLTIKNVVGKNVNAINNNTGTMKLGNVNIDGVYVTISMNGSSINTNSGNGIQTSGALELNGAVTIQNIFAKAENNKTDNSNSAGVVVKNGGSITGTGSVNIIGSQTAPAGYEGYTGLHNGIFITKCSMDIDGDISVSDAKNQGIYVADANAYLGAGNITLKNIKGNGIYVNNKAGKVEAADITVDGTGNHGLQVLGKLYAEDITVSNVSGSYQGIYVRDGGAYVEAASVTVNGVEKGNGIYVNNASGALKVSGDVSIEATGQHGLSSKGTVEAGSLTIKNVGSTGTYNSVENSGTMAISGAAAFDGTTKRGLNSTGTFTAASLDIRNFTENGIQNAGTLKITDAITIADGKGRGHGIYSSKTLEAGSVSISNVTRNGINNAGTFTVTGDVSVKNAVEGGIGSNKNFTAGSVTIDTVTAGPGINNSGTMTVSGMSSVKNITATDRNAIENKGTMTLNDVLVDGVYVTVGVDDEGNQKTFVGNGIYNEKTLTLNGTATITNVFTEEKNNSLGAGFAQATTGTTTGTGGFVITGTEVTNEAYGYGINNGMFVDASSVNLTGDITVSNTLNQGIYVANANATLTAKNINVNGAAGNGIYVNNAAGALTATGDITITGVTGGHGLSTNGVVNAGNITIQTITGGTRNGLEIKKGASLTATGTIQVSEVTQHGINNVGTVNAAAITVDTVGSNGINNNGGTVEVSGAITASNIAGHGVSNNNVLNAGSVSVTNVGGTGNGVQNSGNGVMTVTGAVTVDNVTNGHGIYNGKTVSFGSFASSNTKKNGINNGGSMTVTGAITVSKAGADGVANGGGKTLNAGSITVTDLSGTDGSAVKNSGTMNAGGITISNISYTITKDEAGNALLNKGTLNLTGDVSITNITTSSNTNDTKCHGIYNVGGTITSASEITIYVDGVKRTGLFMDGGSLTGSGITLDIRNTEKTLIRMIGGASIDVLAINADTGNDQGIQLDDACTLKAQVVRVNGVSQNGLRLKNASAQPTVQITALICTNCSNHAIAANNDITSDNLSVGTLYYQNCKNILHGRIKSGVAAQVDMSTLTEEQLTELKAALPAKIAAILFPNTVIEETETTEQQGEATQSTPEQTESTEQTQSTDGTDTETVTNSAEENTSTENQETTTPVAEETSSATEGETDAEQEAA